MRAWLEDGEVPEPWARAWLAWLSLPVEELDDRVSSDTVLAADLRQVSPFAGLLAPRERRAALRAAR